MRVKMPRNIACYVVFVTLLCGVLAEKEEQIHNIFQSNVTRNDFAKLLQSLIKLNEQRVNVLQKLYKLEDYGVISEVLRSGNTQMRTSGNENPNNLFLVVLSKNESNPSRRNMDMKLVESIPLSGKKDSLILANRKKNQNYEEKNITETTTDDISNDIKMIQKNFQLVFGGDIHAKAENKYQDGIDLEDENYKHPITPSDGFDDSDGFTKFQMTSREMQRRYKYSGRGESEEEKEETSNIPKYPQTNKVTTRGDEKGERKTTAKDRSKVNHERNKQSKPNHEIFPKDYTNKEPHIKKEYRNKEYVNDKKHNNDKIYMNGKEYNNKVYMNGKEYNNNKGNMNGKEDNNNNKEYMNGKEDNNNKENIDEKEYNMNQNHDSGFSDEGSIPTQNHPNIPLNMYDAVAFEGKPPIQMDYGEAVPISKSEESQEKQYGKNPYIQTDQKQYDGSEIEVESRKNLQKCLGKKASKLCIKSCISAYKNVCRRLKCTSRSKKSLKKECKKSCKKTFSTSSSKYSTEDSD